MNKTKLFGLMVVLSGALTMSACTTTVEDTVSQPDELSKISVLALDNKNLKITPSDTFSWHDSVAVVGVDEQRQANISARLTGALESGIKERGHSFVTEDGKVSTFKLAAMAILDRDGEEQHSLVLRFGIDPGLGNSQMHHDKGSLVLGVMDNRGNLMWRGVVQIFTDENMDEEVRQQRTQRAVSLLLKELFSKTVVATDATAVP